MTSPTVCGSSLGRERLSQIAPDIVRKHFGYIPQDSRLVNGTLRENILLGLPDPGDDRLKTALEQTALSQMVAAHPMGVALPISEGGRGLSGGQRMLTALTRLQIANPPVQHRIAGTTEPTTRRHMRNKWYMPFCRKLDIEYPSGLRHIIFNSATPIDDGRIQVVQWLYRNDTEADCPTQELIDWDFRITREDKDIIESTDPDTPIDMGRRDRSIR